MRVRQRKREIGYAHAKNVGLLTRQFGDVDQMEPKRVSNFASET
jgi:hypothetical protein